jgi:hypothetical protein
MKLKAKRKFRYAGNRLAPGDRFETRGEQDARLLIAIGHAEPVRERPPKAQPPAPPAPVVPVEALPEPPVVVATVPEPPSVRSDEAVDFSGSRAYKRRDMTAEE